MEIFVLKPLVVWKLNLFSGMQDDALMHREGLKGYFSELVLVLAWHRLVSTKTSTTISVPVRPD